MTHITVPLGELCKIEKGLTGIMKAVPGPYPMVTLAEERTSHNEYQIDAKAVIVPLISSTGHGHASMKRVHYQEGKFALGSILCALTPNDEAELNARFLYNYLSFFKDSLLVPLMRGAANVSLSIKSIAGVHIPMLPLDEQLAVNRLVDNYSRKTKTLQSELQIQQTLLTKLRQAVLQEAVQGKLTQTFREKQQSGVSVTQGVTGSGSVLNTNTHESGADLLARIRAEKAELIRQGRLRKEKPLPPITDTEKPFDLPKGWVWCRLGEVGIMDRGKSKHRPRNDERLFSGGSHPFVQTGDVAQSKKTNYQIRSYSALYNDFGLSQSKKWPVGTLCITIAANIAETGFLTFDACFPDSVVGFTPLADVAISAYVRYYLEISKTEIERFAPATAQKNINLGILDELFFPMPPSNELKMIISEVERFLSKISSLEIENRQQQAEVDRLMQAVLWEAFQAKEEIIVTETL